MKSLKNSNFIRPEIEEVKLLHFNSRVYLKVITQDGEINLEDTEFISNGEETDQFFLPSRSPEKNADLFLREFGLSQLLIVLTCLQKKLWPESLKHTIQENWKSYSIRNKGRQLRKKMNPSDFSETVVEQAALAWLEALGYMVLHGPEIAAGMVGAERRPIRPTRVWQLEGRLRQALVHLNPALPAEALEDAFRKLTRTVRLHR